MQVGLYGMVIGDETLWAGTLLVGLLANTIASCVLAEQKLYSYIEASKNPYKQ